MTFGLLGMVIYIGSLLGKEQSQVTTIKKTKASSMTYSKTVDLNKPISVTPTEIILAQNISPTSEASPEGGIGGFNNSVSTIMPTGLTPTSDLLAKNNLSPTPTSSISATTKQTNATSPTKKIASLPESGKSDYLVSLVVVASIIIFFSFLY